MVRAAQRAEMVSPHRSELFISDLSIRYLSSVQDGRTDRPSFTREFLTTSFKSSAQKYVEVRCCLARNGKSWSARLGGSSVMYEQRILMLGFYQGNNGRSILKPTSYKPLSETGWKDI